jgi:hypothetical protein
MWLKLKELYEVQGFNTRYLTFTTLLSHHYDLSKFIEDYVDQLKTSSRRLQEMDPTFSDWVILTVLLNNLESTFNAFVTAKRQSIRVTTPTFNSLAAELIDEARMKDNKSSVAMAFRGKPKLTSCRRFSVRTVRRLAMRNPCATPNTLIRGRNRCSLGCKEEGQIIVVRQVLRQVL